LPFSFWHFILAYVLDLLLGDPPAWPHPIRWIGSWISWLEKLFFKERRTPFFQRLMGCLFAFAAIAGVVCTVMTLLWLAFFIHPAFGHLVTVWMAYTTLATRSLHLESRHVMDALQKNDLPLARKQLSWIVSRDTEHLDDKGIIRAVIETVSENISDGIVAPLFYLALGGPLWAMVYKTINTMDSMVGYSNDRYRYFGWFAAKVDDLANWIPARLSGLFIIGAAACLRLCSREAWQIMLRDARKMKSPNAGFPEAAAAGALGIQLGGTNVYFGKTTQKPLLGDPQKPLTTSTYYSMIQLMYVTSFSAFVLFLAIQILLSNLITLMK
jgi:adenosylcobinamide-phosphate synthase